jgi:hypothetical protein
MRPWVLAPLAAVLAGCGLVIGVDDASTTTTAATAAPTTVAETTTTRATRAVVVTVATTAATTAVVATTARPAGTPASLAGVPLAPSWRDAGPFPLGPDDATTSTVPNWCGRTPAGPGPTATSTSAWRQSAAGPPTLLVRAERYAAGGGVARMTAVTGVTLPCSWTDSDGNRLVAEAATAPDTGGPRHLVRITDRGTGAIRFVAVVRQDDDVMIAALDGSESARLDAVVNALAARLGTRTG